MPVVFREGPYNVRFFSNENGEPPHVQVDRNGCTAKVWLLPAARLALSRGYSAHEAKAILKLVADNTDRCLES